MKGGITMKQSCLENQCITLAKEKFYKLMQSVPFVSNIEIISTGFQNGFGDFHAIVHFSDNNEIQRYCLYVKTNGEKRFAKLFMKLAEQHNDNSCYVFVAPYISEASAEDLIENKHSYMDLSGNCYILSRRILIHNKGYENEYKEKREKKNYFSKTSEAASTIMRTMLDKPFSEWQVNGLSEITNKSIGMVSNVKSFLRERDWIEDKSNGFALKDIEEILSAWAKDYHKKESKKLEYYSFDSVAILEQKISKWSAEHNRSVLLGGFSAAARYAPTVRYKKVEVYVEQESLNDFVSAMDLQPVSSGGNIVITIPHDATLYMFYREINNSLITSPVQTVIDLLGNAGRGEEAAETIIRKEFKE